MPDNIPHKVSDYIFIDNNHQTMDAQQLADVLGWEVRWVRSYCRTQDIKCKPSDRYCANRTDDRVYGYGTHRQRSGRRQLTVRPPRVISTQEAMFLKYGV